MVERYSSFGYHSDITGVRSEKQMTEISIHHFMEWGMKGNGHSTHHCELLRVSSIIHGQDDRLFGSMAGTASEIFGLPWSW